VPLMTGRSGSLDLAAYGESVFPAHYGWSPLASLRTRENLFVEAPRPELYDVREDPRALKNLAQERAGTVGELRARLEEIRAQSRGGEAVAAPLDEAARARLTALGYLGASPRPAEEDGGALADPKDKIALFNRIREASGDFEAGRIEDAVAKLELVVAEDPEIVEAYNMLGRYRASLGDTAKAGEAYRSALAMDPGYLPARLGLSELHRRAAEARLGARDLAEAAREYQSAVELNPESALAHFDLAKVLGQLGRQKEMIAHLEKSIEADPAFAVGHLYLANVRLEEGDLGRAVDLAKRGIELGPEPSLVPFGHFILADAYGRMGRTEDARREMELAQKIRGETGGLP